MAKNNFQIREAVDNTSKIKASHGNRCVGKEADQVSEKVGAKPLQAEGVTGVKDDWRLELFGSLPEGSQGRVIQVFPQDV